MIPSVLAQVEWLGLGIGLICLVPIVWFIILSYCAFGFIETLNLGEWAVYYGLSLLY